MQCLAHCKVCKIRIIVSSNIVLITVPYHSCPDVERVSHVCKEQRNFPV